MWSIFLPAAHAFCGTFVGGEDASFVNHSSRVVLAREGNHTTLTVAADVQTDAADFGLLLPVPEVLQEEDVQAVDPALISAVDEYSVPRAVAYSCDDVYASTSNDGSAPSLGCGTDTSLKANDAGAWDSGGAGGGPPADNSVEVEAAFAVANYEIVVLSTEDAGDLQAWLDQWGFALPAGGDEILQEYIDAGVYFLAAKVAIDAAALETTWLPPLQFSYETETFGLPIRIGTIAADGVQDVTIFTITATGQTGISNYPQLTVEDECMAEGDLGEAYEAAVAEVSEGGAGWILEHAWNLNQNCDPCTATDSFTVAQMHDLGYASADTGHSYWNLGYLTRLRMRYRPEEATADLVLYESGISSNEQTRYIVYQPELESTFPVCGLGMVEDPGSCDDEQLQVTTCTVAPDAARAGVLGLLVGLGLLRRRRS